MKCFFICFLVVGWIAGYNLSSIVWGEETLCFDEVLQKAIENSYDLKIANLDIAMSKVDVKTAMVNYYPTIRMGANTEYSRDLTGGLSRLAVVGNNVLPSSTAFQNSMGLNLNYTLLDFGVRKRLVQIAQKDIQNKGAVYQQQLRDLSIKIVDLYANALLNYSESQTNQKILKLDQELFRLKQALYDSGVLSKVQLSDVAIQTAKSLDELTLNQEKYRQLLQELSFYTHEPYDDTVVIQAFTTSDPEETFDLPEQNNLPEYITYQTEIEKKTKELEIKKREHRFPTISTYSSYYLFGSNPNDYLNAYKDLSQRNITVGLSTTFYLFDGFKNSAEQGHLVLEIEKLKQEREKALETLQNDFQKVKLESQYTTKEIKNKQDIEEDGQEKLILIERLTTQEMLDQTYLLTERIEYITKEQEMEKAILRKAAAQRKLALYQGGY